MKTMFLTGLLVLVMVAGAVAEDKDSAYLTSTAPVYTQVVFHLGGGEELILSWADDTFRVTYPPDKMNEAGKILFKWLTGYIEFGYDITPKKR